MTSPNLAPSTTQGRDRLLAGTGALLLATTIALLLVGLQSLPPELGCDFTKAILCAEFPTSGGHLDAVLASPPNALWQWQLAVWLDMGFLVFYGALLALSAKAIGGPRWLVTATATAATLGAGLDVAENIGILVAAGDVATDGLALLTNLAASTKFTVLGLACAGIGVLAFAHRHRRPWLALTLGLGGALALGAALTGWAVPRAFELGATGIAVSCLALWVRAIRGLRRKGTAHP